MMASVRQFASWSKRSQARDKCRESTDIRYGSARALLPAAAICFGLTASSISDLARAQSGNHGDGHAENHDWYQNLTQADTGFPCCNGSTSSVEGDCRPTRAFLDEDGLWYALLDGQWVPIPPRWC